jgi:hypothetical protein
VYGCIAGRWCESPNYVTLAAPLLAALGFAAVAGVVYGLWSPARSPQLRIITSMVLVLIFSFEVTAGRTYFMPYSHGPLDSASRQTLSHLSESELEIAASIRGFGEKVVLISDPHTMANLRALTGLNSIVSFSNLDTMGPETTELIRSWIRSIVTRPPNSQSCGPHPVSAVLKHASAAEFNYWLVRHWKAIWSGSVALGIFGYRDSFLLTEGPRPDQLVTARDLLPRAHDLLPRAHDELAPRGIPRHAWRQAALADVAATASLPGRESSGDPWEREPMFLLVINQKTLDWASSAVPVSYYADTRTLDRMLLEDLHTRCDVRVHDGRFALVRFPFSP